MCVPGQMSTDDTQVSKGFLVLGTGDRFRHDNRTRVLPPDLPFEFRVRDLLLKLWSLSANVLLPFVFVVCHPRSSFRVWAWAYQGSSFRAWDHVLLQFVVCPPTSSSFFVWARVCHPLSCFWLCGLTTFRVCGWPPTIFV